MAELTNDSAVEGLGHFFDTIWRDESGYVYLPTLDRKADDWKKIMYKWPESRENIINHVLSKNAQGLDVYYSPVLFDREKPPKPVKENVKGSWVVWADYDGSAPKEWSPDTAEAVIPPPSLRVQSSNDGNEHAYWKLDEFTNDVAWIENTNRSITYSTRADTGGWDIVQVLRPPYTQNYKYEDTPPVTVAFDSRSIYNQQRFAQLKPVQQLVSDAVDTENLPIVEQVIAKYAWDTENFKFFMDPAIEEGKRSAALMRLGYTCAEMGMNDAEIYSIIENADARWGKYVKRADRKVRLLDIVNRARTKHPHGTKDLTFAGLSGNQEVEQGTELVYGFKDFIESHIEIEWAIEEFIEKGGLGMVAAAPGVGKTQLSIQLGIACALGIPFLGWKPARPQKMAIFSLEMSHVALKKFMTVIAKSYDEDQIKLLQDNLIIIPIGERLPLDKPAARTFLNTMMDQIKPDGVIFDSLVKLSSTKLDEESVGTINDQLGILRKKYGCWAWLIHHNRKANGETNKEPDSLDDVYGSVFIAAEMTAVLLLYRKRGAKQIAVINVKNRLHEERPTFMVERDEHLFFREANPPPTFEGLTNVTNEPDKPTGEGFPNIGM